jgi:hypothetical protein
LLGEGKKRMGKVQIGTVPAVVAVMLAIAPVSYGESSSVEAYGGHGGSVAGNVAGGSAETASPTWDSPSSALPFTGLDVALLGGGGLILLLAGVALSGLTGRMGIDYRR